MKRLFLDVETYSNYFLVVLREHATNKTIALTPVENETHLKTLRRALESYQVITFNGTSYDLPMIAHALAGYSTEQLKKLSDRIINENLKAWQHEHTIQCDHIDLIELAIGKSSLKQYSARLNTKNLQELPYEPDTVLTDNMKADTLTYCINDTALTAELYEHLLPQIQLREKMTAKYGVDLRSKSDAQIAEAVLKKEIETRTGKRVTKPQIKALSFKYLPPSCVAFKSSQLIDLLNVIKDLEFTVSNDGEMKFPQVLLDTKISIGKSTYQLGAGGLHSMEKAQTLVGNLIDADVASYYPSMISKFGWYPTQLGLEFLDLYKSIIQERLAAKKSGDKVTDAVLKITLNGSFGKFGSKYSILYAPQLLIQTTLTGQLLLLMLIEELEQQGIQVVSANTDGIVSKVKSEQKEEYKSVCKMWQEITGMGLEFTPYQALYSRDVNNYVAIKNDGSVKTKGVFAPPSIAKNPDFPIVQQAVVDYLSKNIAIEQTINDCQDISKFLSVRRVTGGAETETGRYVGKVVRFYIGKNGGGLFYCKNSNKVPKSEGAVACMILPDQFPKDMINYDFYIQEAYKLLKSLGIDSET